MKLVSSMLVLLAGLFSACSPRQQADYFTPVAESQLRAPAYPSFPSILIPAAGRSLIS